MKSKELAKRLSRIAEIIETIEQRCMATDGPVTPTTKEITEAELRAIYQFTQFRRGREWIE